MSLEASSIQIKKDRFLKQNPYAHIDGEGKLSALAPTYSFVEATLEEIAQDRILLENPYAHDYGTHGFQAIRKLNPVASLQLTEFNAKPRDYYSDKEIEKFARTIQIELWKNRKSLLSSSSNPIELLDPELAFKALGFNFELVETLGQFQRGDVAFEVAGTINKKLKRIQISRQFPSETRRFTAAHELGHAVMHASNGMHRDRPINSAFLQNRSSTEIQADKFATYFLMPEKLVRKIFKQLFLADQFYVDENTAFALGYDYTILKTMSVRELAKLLAKSEKYNFKNFSSLANHFYVSEQAMAIRLEELNLIASS